MTEQEIYRGLQQVFDSVFRRHDIRLTPTLSAEDVPGWDSFMQVNLIVGTEELFEISLVDTDIDDLANIGDLVRAVARLTA
jgi:acyl carrier protein